MNARSPGGVIANREEAGRQWRAGGYFCRVGRVYATLKPALSRLRCDTLPGVASTEAVVQPAEAAAFRRMATRPSVAAKPEATARAHISVSSAAIVRISTPSGTAGRESWDGRSMHRTSRNRTTW